MYHPWFIVTLTSDLVFLESASTLVYISLFEVGMPNLVCGYWIDLGMADSHIPFLGHCDLDL